MTGEVDYFEIGTPDPDGARRFYGGLFGWTIERREGTADHRLVVGDQDADLHDRYSVNGRRAVRVKPPPFGALVLISPP